MRYTLFLILTISTLAFGDPLFYFHENSTWTYEVTGKNIYEVTNKVTEVKTIKGINWYKLTEYGVIFWVRNSERGQVEAVNFFESNPSQLDTPEEILIFKYPAQKGDTWDNYGSPTKYQGLQEITVPAGKFSCHMYFIDMDNGNYSKSCIAQDVGVIYNEAILNNNEKEISKLLTYK